MLEKVKKDLNAVFRHDPAARSKLEVVLTYSGFHALVMYRFAHFLYLHRWRLAARMVSQFAKFLTGVEIHPAARIGTGVVIDHGEGVVIGETAEVGNNVLIYQGVTLGGTGKDKGKRHPTVCDNLMISAGGQSAGSIHRRQGRQNRRRLHRAERSAANATRRGRAGRVVRINGERVDDLDQTLPDPVTEECEALCDKIAALTARVEKLERERNE